MELEKGRWRPDRWVAARSAASGVLAVTVGRVAVQS